ncbi:MAG: nucleoside-diphosphate kinase [Chloroflexi bacterium]|nr:nucleoside-diphosphate kinase [Chloroflexota bacterium]
MERTLVLVKPDGVQRGLIGEIVGRLERRGLQIVGAKLTLADRALAEKHYAEHVGKGFYEGLVRYITSTPVLALVLEGDRAVEIARQTMGATDPLKAAPGTIRGDLALTVGRNLVHGSDSAQRGAEEIALWFTKNEVVDYRLDLQGWLTES